MLLRAFAEIRRQGNDDLALVMAGPPANERYLADLQKIAHETLGPQVAETAVTFPGMLTGQTKWGAFSAAEAFVLPSHQENFGIAVVEAMACGTPVLISNQVNIWREIVEDGAGYAENDDLAGTTRLLERWLETPPEERSAMQDNARASFARRFGVESAVNSLVEKLSGALKDSAPN